ncbi:MAG: virulence RhuM family protein [Pseudomonadales bacterium]|nr:virulence RhuM family protein [Pseudomonadales bacterium]
MTSPDNHSQFIIYQDASQNTHIQVRLSGNTLWLTQAQIAELFQTTPQNITLHIKSIYEEGELDESATCKDYLQVRQEGKREVNRQLKHYNLLMVIALGYRVRSTQGTRFRQWASSLLDEYLVKGFTMDDERLKNPDKNLGVDYFDELLQRIRDIRNSEKRFYQKIRDIYALATDYDPKAEETREFFKVVQNKLHWSISGLTAAELIAQRADSKKDNMGLTNWQGDRVRKVDVSIAKNYLDQSELEQLNRLVVMYLDYAESQAQRRKTLFMQDWREKLDAFLQFNERDILGDAGKVKMAVAKKLAAQEYDKFNQQRLLNEAKTADENDLEQLVNMSNAIEKPKDKKG